MSTTGLTIHDATWPLYRQLAMPEQGNDGTYWKTWRTESISITVFRPTGPDTGDND